MMQTHTIRNKNKPNPILTFKPKFFELVKQDVEAFSLMWSWFARKYKELTGRDISIHYEQQIELDELFKNAEFLDIKDTYAYKVYNVFQMGFIHGNHDGLYEAFQTAHYHYWLFRQVTESKKQN